MCRDPQPAGGEEFHTVPGHLPVSTSSMPLSGCLCVQAALPLLFGCPPPARSSWSSSRSFYSERHLARPLASWDCEPLCPAQAHAFPRGEILGKSVRCFLLRVCEWRAWPGALVQLTPGWSPSSCSSLSLSPLPRPPLIPTAFVLPALRHAPCVWHISGVSACLLLPTTDLKLGGQAFMAIECTRDECGQDSMRKCVPKFFC